MKRIKSSTNLFYIYLVAIQCLETAYDINPMDASLQTSKRLEDIFAEATKGDANVWLIQIFWYIIDINLNELLVIRSSTGSTSVGRNQTRSRKA